MNPSDQNKYAGSSGSGEFEATLRMIASLPAPEGIAERVEVGLWTAPRRDADKARILAWPVALRLDNAWARSSLARTAAAAAIVLVVIGGGWGVYSRVQPAQPARLVVPLRAAPPGGFSSAGAMRTPQTLNGPVVAHPETAPAAAAKTAPKTPAQPPVHRSKSVAAQKAAAQPTAPPAR
jgi:hypothetical protein